MGAFVGHAPSRIDAPPVRAATNGQRPELPLESPRLPPASVLAVSVDPMIRDLLLELAVENGYGVYCASGALEALGVLGRERPGAVLVDLDMPNAAGVRFLDIFRRLRPQDFIVCLAVTANPRFCAPPDVAVFQKPAVAGMAEALIAHFEASAGARPG